MATQRDDSVDRSSEHEEFIAKLREYHAKRGTAFDPEPKVGQRRVDLLKLWNQVIADGGYDKVSNNRLMPLAWKNIGAVLGLDRATHPTALAFMLKTVFYRNLAAYEISTIHKKEPPPREILEDISARGGNLLTRTIENYPLRGKGTEEDEVDNTPNADKMDLDEPSSGRAMRAGLRQAPPQRQLFQADPASTYRQGRGPGGRSSSPNPAAYGGGLGNLSNATAAQALANYEPRPAFPLSLRPVLTPASNPEQFKVKQAAIRDAYLARLSGRPPQLAKANIMLPGTGFPGPNIYVRTWMALRSGLLDEQEYALHHLVKISFERGDKYRFDQFSGLIEALVDKILETCSFFYDIDWKLSYNDEDQALNNVLDALHGSPDVLQRFRRAKRKVARDKLETDDITRRLRLIAEAGLVIRNLVTLDDNAEYALRYPPTRDTLTILLNLPDDPAITEIKHYALEIIEHLAKFIQPSANNALVSTLMTTTLSSDRGVILTALRAVSRIGTRLDRVTSLPVCPIDVVHRLCEWLLIEDQDLRTAALDVLYRYTANVDHVNQMLHQIDTESQIRQLTRLLQFGARHEENHHNINSHTSHQQQQRPHQPSDSQPIPKISQDHIAMLLVYEEPERSTQWLRACFYEDPGGEITQIALWQAYQIPFTPYSTSRPLLPAKDFITNVSTTFTHATAQVIPGEQPKFIIKGIRPRQIPVDPKGKSFMKCRWLLQQDASAPASNTEPADGECTEFAMAPARMWEHIVTAHLGVPKNDEGNLDPSKVSDAQKATCRWAGCSRFATSGADAGAQDQNRVFAVGMHVKTHLPDINSTQHTRSRSNVASPTSPMAGTHDATTLTYSSENTLHDERFEAVGLPLTSCLVLRNLARNIPKTAFAKERRDKQGSVVQALFAPVMPQLYHVLAYNRALADTMSGLIRLVEKDG